MERRGNLNKDDFACCWKNTGHCSAILNFQLVPVMLDGDDNPRKEQSVNTHYFYDAQREKMVKLPAE